MATAKINGTLYSVPPNVVGSGAGGNGGSVAKANDSSLLDGVEVSRYDSGVFASTVIDGDNTDKVVVSEDFAKDTQRPLGKVVSQTVANQPEYIRSIHKGEVYRTRKLTTAIREGKWNQFTGEFDPTYPENVVDNFEPDSAASPSRTLPGTLVYKSSAPDPVSDIYKEKTG